MIDTYFAAVLLACMVVMSFSQHNRPVDKVHFELVCLVVLSGVVVYTLIVTEKGLTKPRRHVLSQCHSKRSITLRLVSIWCWWS